MIFLPYLSGERSPHADPHARGAFVGLTLRHGRAHMARAVMEGVAFALRDVLDLARAAGTSVQRVRASGGAVRSEAWRSILASTLDAEVATVNATQGAALGAALLAGVGAGIWPTVQDACRATIRETSVTPPRDADGIAGAYARYRALYPCLRGEFAALSALETPEPGGSGDPDKPGA